MLASVIALAATSASAVPIEISARPSLDVNVTTIGRVVRLAGQLRDDLGRPIPRQSIHVQIDGESARELHVETDARGAIGTSLVLDDGAHNLRLMWSGDPVREAVAIDVAVEVRQAQGGIMLDAPGTAVADSSWPVALRVTADGAPVAGAIVALGGDCLRPRLAKTGHDGTLTVEGWARRPADTQTQVPVDPPRAQCTVTASVSSGAIHGSATASASTRIVDQPRLELAVGEPQHGLLRASRWPVTGTLSDAHGPIESASVRLLLDGNEVAGAPTDQAGRFSLSWTANDVEPGLHSLRARFETDEGSGTIESAGVPIAIARDPSAIVALVALPLAVIGALVVFASLSTQLRRRAPHAPTARTGATATVVAGTPGVHLVDATSRAPIAGELVLHWSDHTSESFVLEPAEAVRPRADVSATRITAHARGYISADLHIDAPIDRRLEVALVSFRAAVRAVLEDVAAEQGGPRRGWWGRREAAEVAEELAARVAILRRDDIDAATFNARLDALVERARSQAHGAPAAAVEALAMLVERANFGPRIADADDLALARELAATVLRARSA